MKRLHLIILIGIILLAAFLRIYGIDRQSLWYDEAFEMRVSQKLFSSNPFSSEKLDNSWLTPLNLVFIKFVSNIFPGNDTAIRYVPVTFGLISIPLLFLLVRRLYNENVGLIACYLLAISPYHIWYSQEARMYVLLWMLSLISIIYFLRTLEKPGRINYIVYIISTAAALYSHQLAMFLLAIQGLYLLFYIRQYKSQLFKWIGAFSAVVIMYMPLLILSMNTLAKKNFGFPKGTDISLVPYTLFTYSAGFSIGPSLRELHLDRSIEVIKPHINIILSLAVVYGTLLISGIWSTIKDYSRLLLVLLLFIVPIGGVFALVNFKSNVQFSVRHTGLALFGFLIFISKGIEWLSRLNPGLLGRAAAILAIISVTGFSGYAYTNYQFDKRYHKEDIRGTVDYINENRMAGDALLCIFNNALVNWYTEYRGYNFHCDRFSFFEKTNGPVSINQSKVETALKKMVRGRKRIWFVINREWYPGDVLSLYIKDWLNKNYKEITSLHRGMSEYANVNIYCYDLTNPGVYPKKSEP